MNHYNHNKSIDNTEGPNDDRRQLKQTSQTVRTSNNFFESGTTFPRSKVERYNTSSSRGTPSVMRTVSSQVIPDIRLEAPSENLVLDTLEVCDIHEDLKLKMSEILDRLQNVDPEDVSQVGDLVTLPCRYTRRLSGARDAGRSPGREVSPVDEDMGSRESDLGTALKWIRQEILHMKQQDTCLLRQFAHLHDSILQLRGLYDPHGSYSDVSSLDGSTYSLNEQARSPRLHRLVLDGSYTSKPSVSLPSSPRVSRYKWGSQDII